MSLCTRVRLPACLCVIFAHMYLPHGAFACWLHAYFLGVLFAHVHLRLLVHADCHVVCLCVMFALADWGVLLHACVRGRNEKEALDHQKHDTLTGNVAKRPSPENMVGYLTAGFESNPPIIGPTTPPMPLPNPRIGERKHSYTQMHKHTRMHAHAWEHAPVHRCLYGDSMQIQHTNFNRAYSLLACCRPQICRRASQPCTYQQTAIEPNATASFDCHINHKRQANRENHCNLLDHTRAWSESEKIHW